MISLIHLLEHLGVPSGLAIAMVVAGKRSLRSGAARWARRHRGHGAIRDGGFPGPPAPTSW